MGRFICKAFMAYVLSAGIACLGITGAQAAMDADMQQIDKGRYLSRIGGCNDCHTDGYLLSEGKVPEEQWLTGSGFGWRGPWGTTYASNLRRVIAPLSEEQWLTLARHLKARPPMPWFNLNIMTDEDLKALYAYIHARGAAGEVVPAYVPPGEEPKTPYALFPAPPSPK